MYDVLSIHLVKSLISWTGRPPREMYSFSENDACFYLHYMWTSFRIFHFVHVVKYFTYLHYIIWYETK